MKPYRKERISVAIRNVISEAIAFKMHDPRLEPLTSVSRVELSRDLLVATVHLSVPGGDVPERRTLSAIRHAGGYLQRLVAGRLQIRQCPSLQFELDARLKGARETLKLLDENRRKNPQLYESLEVGDGNSDGDGGGAAEPGPAPDPGEIPVQPEGPAGRVVDTQGGADA